MSSNRIKNQHAVPPTLSQEQARQRAEIALQTADFLTKGGKVTRLDVKGEIL